MANLKTWQPPEFVDRERCIKDTEEILGQPDLADQEHRRYFSRQHARHGLGPGHGCPRTGGLQQNSNRRRR